MTLAEFFAAVDGWNRVHGGDSKPEPPSDNRLDEMIAERKRD
jgi:hypothetical protein